MNCIIVGAALSAIAAGPGGEAVSPPPGNEVPRVGGVSVDTNLGEVAFPARVQHPTGKPCIDAWGRRTQAFIGSAKADGKPAEFADHFVFLADVDTVDVYRGLAELGLNTKIHYSRAEGRERAGKDFLDGDPVAVFVKWKDGEDWVERRYEDFVQEQRVIDGKTVAAPWTPRWVFHGSGVVHKEGTGCIACPCDCPGGLIADNRNPIYEPKPIVRFNLKDAPPKGTKVWVRIKAVPHKAPSEKMP